jgi:hypothetical protein
VRREIKRNDAAHAHVIQLCCQQSGGMRSTTTSYLSTERLPIDVYVNQVGQLAASPAFQGTESSQTALADRLLKVRIRNRIGEALGERLLSISP